MKKNLVSFTVCLIITILFSSCGPKEDKTQINQDTPQIPTGTTTPIPHSNQYTVHRFPGNYSGNPGSCF